MRRILILLAVISAICSCSHKGKAWEDLTVEERLEEMRNDDVLLHYADSLAALQFGPGAKCLDFVQHRYTFEGKSYLYNEDWGGVLAIPDGWIPEDDEWQAELSFHGTRVWSPDSTVVFITYAGFCGYGNIEEAMDVTANDLTDGGVFRIIEQRVDTIDLCGNPVQCIITRARNDADGVNYYGREIYRDRNGVNYAVSLQYTDEVKYDLDDLLKRADDFPAVPQSAHLYSDQFTL